MQARFLTRSREHIAQRSVEPISRAAVRSWASCGPWTGEVKGARKLAAHHSSLSHSHYNHSVQPPRVVQLITTGPLLSNRTGSPVYPIRSGNYLASRMLASSSLKCAYSLDHCLCVPRHHAHVGANPWGPPPSEFLRGTGRSQQLLPACHINAETVTVNT